MRKRKVETVGDYMITVEQTNSGNWQAEADELNGPSAPQKLGDFDTEEKAFKAGWDFASDECRRRRIIAPA